jgi:uncharacterized protein with PIN domain
MLFVCDDHLGKLARLLRTCGFDARWVASGSNAEIVKASAAGRVFITRDRSWQERTLPEPTVVVAASNPYGQLREVIAACHLRLDAGALFTRCTVCNGVTEPVAKSLVESRLPPHVRRTIHHFRICPGCDRIYWEGTHVTAIRTRLAAEGFLKVQ